MPVEELDMSIDTQPDVGELLRIRDRYEHVVALAREARWCVCNSSRSFADVAREAFDYLLEGRECASPGQVVLDLRSQHCPVHSPPLASRPWLVGGGEASS